MEDDKRPFHVALLIWVFLSFFKAYFGGNDCQAKKLKMLLIPLFFFFFEFNFLTLFSVDNAY